jgi:purine-binding chemotaxis protein CheW
LSARPRPEALRSFLVLRARSTVVAIALPDVVEVTPVLPIEAALGGAEGPGLLGVTLLRGAPVPVVDLGALLGSAEPPAPRRFVSLRAGERAVAIAVEEVLGVRRLEASQELPPLLRNEHTPLAGLLLADRRLAVVLEAARVVPPSASTPASPIPGGAP